MLVNFSPTYFMHSSLLDLFIYVNKYYLNFIVYLFLIHIFSNRIHNINNFITVLT